MPTVRAIDMLLLDDVFDMSSGYVLDFTDRTFAQFFAQELNCDIHDSIYAKLLFAAGRCTGHLYRNLIKKLALPLYPCQIRLLALNALAVHIAAGCLQTE